jgi:hypothetical protein
MIDSAYSSDWCDFAVAKYSCRCYRSNRSISCFKGHINHKAVCDVTVLIVGVAIRKNDSGNNNNACVIRNSYIIEIIAITDYGK